VKSSHQIILGIVLAFVLYVLSPGPVVAYYLQRSITPPTPVMMFYAPLGWCCGACPPLATVMSHYIKLWAPNA